MQTTEAPLTFLNWRRIDIPDWEQLVAVLWPVLVYDALVPTSPPSDLNILQDYVLRFASLGIRDSHLIGQHLSLDPQLVEVVKTELRHDGYLKADGLPTDRAVVEEEERIDSPSELCSVIQDPFTGRVWPTVPKRLRPADLEWNDSGTLLPLQRTTVRVETVPLNGIKRRPPAPSPSEIVRASDASRTFSALSRRARSWTDAWDDDQLEFSLSRIDVLDDQPVARWMPAVLYLPAPPNDIDGTCAFGVDGSPSLLLVDALDKAAGLGPTAEQIQLRLDKAARTKRYGRYREYVARVSGDAQREIESRVDRGWRNEEHLWRELIALQTMILEAEVDQDRELRLMQEALTCAVRLFEGLFKILYSRIPLPPAIAHQLSENERHVRKRRKVEDPVIKPAITQASEGWARQKLPTGLPRQTDQAEGQVSGITWHVERAILSAHYNVSHPLRRLLDDRPDWLLRVLEVNKMRNKAGAHYGALEITAADGLQAGKDGLKLVIDALGYVTAGRGSDDGE